MNQVILGGASIPSNSREKHVFLPQITDGAADSRACTTEPVGIYPCPCCGCRTYPVPPEEDLAYICPVCFWENDRFITSEDEPSDQNHGMTLTEARKNYGELGAVRADLVKYVRKPTASELSEEK